MKCRGTTRNSIGQTVRRYRLRVISGMRVPRTKSRIRNRNIRAYRAHERVITPAAIMVRPVAGFWYRKKVTSGEKRGEIYSPRLNIERNEQKSRLALRNGRHGDRGER